MRNVTNLDTVKLQVGQVLSKVPHIQTKHPERHFGCAKSSAELHEQIANIEEVGAMFVRPSCWCMLHVLMVRPSLARIRAVFHRPVVILEESPNLLLIKVLLTNLHVV